MPNPIIPLQDTDTLGQRFNPEVRQFLRAKCGNVTMWLRDAFRLVEQYKGSRDFYDFSFAITPAFKALEEWLLIIAPMLGVPPTIVEDARRSGNLGSFLKDDQIEKFIVSSLRKLEMAARTKKHLRTAVQSLNSYLRDFRHTPAHSTNTIDSGHQAEMVVFQITGAINDLTRNLLEAGVLKSE